MESLTQQGIYTMRQGDKTSARLLLLQAVQQNPQDVIAWLWLSGAVSTDQERLECLQQVIRIDPENAVAAKGIAQLISRGSAVVKMASAKTEVEQAISPGTHVAVQEPDPQPLPLPAEPLLRPQRFEPRPVKKPQRRASDEILFKVSPSPIPVIIRGGFLLILLALAAMLFREVPVMQIFMVVPLVIFTIGLVIIRLIQRSFAVYTLTRSQLIFQKGVLNKQKKTIPVHKIQDVSYRQPILDRIFGLGDVIVESAGERGEVRLVSLHNCVEMSEEILKVVQSE